MELLDPCCRINYHNEYFLLHNNLLIQCKGRGSVKLAIKTFFFSGGRAARAQRNACLVL